MDLPQLQLVCHINERETLKTCFNQSQRHHIMPLFINSLGEGHTNTHTVATEILCWAGAIEPSITTTNASRGFTVYITFYNFISSVTGIY